MLFPHVAFVLEVVGACLLAVVIVYAAVLNRRLSALRADKAHLRQLVASFNESTSRAEAGVGRMRVGAEEAAGLLQTRIGEARQLHDDLAYMEERAASAAKRLEKAIGSSRAGPSGGMPLENTDALAPIEAANVQAGAAGSAQKAKLWRSLKGLR